MTLMSDVMKQWKQVMEKENKILFIVGEPGSGKSELLRRMEFQSGWKYTEAKELLGNSVFEVNRAHRPDQAKQNLMESVAYLDAKVTIIDNVGILFAPIYNINPVEIMVHMSHDHPIVVGWSGHFDGSRLSLDYNGNENFAQYPVADAVHVFSLQNQK